MNPTALWQRYQDWLYYHDGLGLYLDISRIRFDDDFVATLQPKFEKAFDDMAALEGGAIANPDEGRMVGHYWLRNPDIAPTPEIRDSIVSNIQTVEEFVAKIHSGEIRPPEAPKFEHVLSVGIGGSALGPQFVAEAISPDVPPMTIHFIDNTDPAGMRRTMTRMLDQLPSTLILNTSKSGGTPETRNGMLEVKAAYEKLGLDFVNHAVAITMAGSKMDTDIAKAEGWLAEFYMYDWIGGRTSVMSDVGLLPAALQGIDIRAMLEGARVMDEATRVRNLKTNPAALLAMAWYHSGNGKGEKDMVVLPYKDSLMLFSRYLQQLIMESLGKEKDLDGNIVHQGIAVYGNKGSTDQHAYVQQLRDGVPNFFATLIEVLDDLPHQDDIEVEPDVTSGDYLNGFLYGTRSALYDNGRDSVTITIPDVNPRIVGGLIALYERAVSFYASLVNINAYHQPGVEAGKKAAATILNLQSRVLAALRQANQPLGLEDLAAQAGAADEAEAVYKIVRHLAANDRGLTLAGNLAKPASLKVSLR
ncbi:MAG: glucose-6-phosphate isomerase [Leptolyngbyaceae cyanobacterium SM2_3_12]|nr:glucose-6-phosphate isomerase [Leptolyngbyaceae cyanobacterium SM2_3_12]